jgi:ferredoxin
MRSVAADPVRLHIDWTACDGRGLCVELAPELLDRDEWGYPIPRQPPGASVPGDMAAAAQDAVAACPKRALRLVRT